MVGQGQETAALTSEFLSALDRIDSVDAAMDVLEQHLGQLGFPMVDYGYVRSPLLPTGKWMPPTLKTRNFPRNWNAQWDRHDINDPYYHASFNQRTLIRWVEIQNQPRLTLAQRNCRDYLSDKGMSCGITIPMHRHDGSFAFMSILGDSDSDSDAWYHSIRRHELSLVHMAHYFNNTLLGRFANGWQSLTQKPLPPREAECLSWAAQGKTSSEIAIILGLSVETVRVYIKRACRRLNAANRSQAIAKAVQMGHIEL